MPLQAQLWNRLTVTGNLQGYFLKPGKPGDLILGEPETGGDGTQRCLGSLSIILPMTQPHRPLLSRQRD